jgi:hypothetical protein
MMRRLTDALAAFVLLAGCASSQARRDAQFIGQGPALFVARDADSTMYLFGTVHLRRPNTEWGGPNAQAALASAEEVWTEIEISPETDAQGQALALQLGMSPQQPLSNLLSAEEYARLEALSQRLGLPMPLLNAMQPWLAAITLSVMPMIQAGYDPNSGVDRAIDAFGDRAGKSMRAFETVEEQVRFLAGFSPEVQRQWLVEAIDEAEQGPALLDGLTTSWEQGDLAALETLVVEDMRNEAPDLYQVLVVQRNAAWMDHLMRELDGSGVDFVAVGAAHLLGRDGLIAQLRARGVTVERVTP